ncbi:GNAT family N-acetyltransferase [Skermania piniformis]|uniref:GNAT family N-acetyltransferase n=1 Tax=Skermania pinensis TaxID=39122 RepID=A0ABX8S9S0_9ACTN|nr:GNAT family protein [Skermania piniformis]QXQ12466.1 GNAT family N-acetyltransferase [Skermania piniformis]
MVSCNEYGQPVGVPVAWSGPAGTPATTHHGRWVELRLLTTGFATDITGTLSPYPRLWTYLPTPAPGDPAAAAAGIDMLTGTADAVGYAILDRATGQFAGQVAYLRIQPAIGSIEVGWICYAPWFQRTRGATETQYLLMRHAFELGYRRYEWKCDALNQPSRAAAARLGFVEEGTWRNAMIVKGRNRDTTWFSITDAEWPAVRAALETWLDERNFTTDGAQRRSLGTIRVGS